MRRNCAWHRWSATFLVLALTGVASSPVFAKTAPRLKVVASTSDLAALAAEVGGSRIEMNSLVQGNQDPHFVQAKPSYLLKLRRADLLIVVGLELESSWLTRPHHTPSLLSQSGNPRIQPGASGYFDASKYSKILESPTPPLTPSIQPFGNPHYWLDPENGRRIAEALAKKMGEIHPSDSSYFNERFSAFAQRLSEAEKKWDAEMEPYRGLKVVTYSRTWSSFLRRFQLVSVGEIEPQPGIPPSRGHTAALANLMKSEGVRIILVEPYFELSTPNAIARETGAEVVVLPSSVGGEKGVDNYFQLFDYNLGRLTSAFQSQSGEGLVVKSDRDFVLLMLMDSAKVQAMVQHCSEKHVRQELRTLCRQIMDVRKQEAQILAGWLSSWFQTSAPPGDESTVPLGSGLGMESADGSQFEITFLNLMIQEDWEELSTDHACMANSSREALRNLCTMITRARSIEIQLMRSQLCLWHHHCESQEEHEHRPPVVETAAAEPKSGSSRRAEWLLDRLVGPAPSAEPRSWLICSEDENRPENLSRRVAALTA